MGDRLIGTALETDASFAKQVGFLEGTTLTTLGTGEFEVDDGTLRTTESSDDIIGPLQDFFARQVALTRLEVHRLSPDIRSKNGLHV